MNEIKYMTPGEIIAAYRQSKRKKEQIKILADLNLCTTDDIIKIIVENSNGEFNAKHFNAIKSFIKKDVIKKVESEKKEETSEKEREPIPSAVTDVIKDKILALNVEVDIKKREMVELASQIDKLTQYIEELQTWVDGHAD